MYSAVILDSRNLRLGERVIRSLGVDRLDRSGGLCSESLTNILDTSVFPACVTGSAERMQHTIVGCTCPILDAWSRNAGHDINIGSQLAAIVVKGQVVDIVAEGVLNFGATKKKLVWSNTV
jgi:hypothetical protein